jgi:hypothetical protein
MENLTYELVDLGIHHPDYFQGFGTSFTNFENCCYGIGHNPESAFKDCLDMMAQSEQLPDGLDWDALRAEILADNKWAKRKTPKVKQASERNEYCQNYYHIGIRWSLVNQEEWLA